MHDPNYHAATDLSPLRNADWTYDYKAQAWIDPVDGLSCNTTQALRIQKKRDRWKITESKG